MSDTVPVFVRDCTCGPDSLPETALMDSKGPMSETVYGETVLGSFNMSETVPVLVRNCTAVLIHYQRLYYCRASQDRPV